MAGARSAIAGVLAAAVVVLATRPTRDQADTLQGLAALLVVLALLVGVDVAEWWKRRSDR